MNAQGTISERASHYGDGLFETIAIRDGEPRLWSYHVERLEEGCRRLGFVSPDGDALRDGLDAVLSSSGKNTSRCIAKLIVSAVSTGRGYGRRVPSPIEAWTGVFPAAPLEASAYSGGVETILCETRLATGSAFAGLKTLNRLEQVRARSECVQSGAFEGLTLDADGCIICGTMSNVFFVRDNQVMTPSLVRCGVAGVMRRFVIETLEGAGMPASIRDIRNDDLSTMDEVFIANSQLGVVPVRSCDEHRWPVGPVTRRVMDLLFERGIDECRP